MSTTFRQVTEGKVKQAVSKLMASKAFELANLHSAVDEVLLKHMLEENKLFLVYFDIGLNYIFNTYFPDFAYKELMKTDKYKEAIDLGYREEQAKYNPVRGKYYDISYDPLTQSLFGYMHLSVRFAGKRKIQPGAPARIKNSFVNIDIKIEDHKGHFTTTHKMPSPANAISLKSIFPELLEQQGWLS